MKHWIVTGLGVGARGAGRGATPELKLGGS